MAVEYINCKEIASKIKLGANAYINESNRLYSPCLAFIQVGNNPASNSYVKYKMKDCDEVGISYEVHKFNKQVSRTSIIKLIKDLNRRTDIHGIMVQLPLPGELSYFKSDILNAIDPKKDVDGLTPTNQGLITNNDSFHLVPCTPWGVMEIINYYSDTIKESLEGKKALVVGRSDLVGKPLAQLLVANDLEVTVCHSRVPFKTTLQLIEESDIICLAVGSPKFFNPKKIKENALVVDIGTTYIRDKLYGDFDGSNIDPNIHYYATPVPGGIGPLTRAGLMHNVASAYNKFSI